MSGRRARLVRSTITASLLAAGALIWAAQPSFAVHDNGMFELDGNTAQPAAGPPYDWEGLFDATGNPTVTPGTDGLLASGFFPDAAKPDHSYFARSDKDIHDVSTWKCKSVHMPTPKDDLLNAYAAVVHVPKTAPDNAGDKVLYLGSERRTNEGDVFAGFWLLKDPNAGCSSASGTTGFTGQHTVGDLLVVSDYTNGGTKHAVTVYAWDPNARRNLRFVANGGICGSGGADNVCAIANSTTIQPSWDPSVGKKKKQGLRANQFVEAGVDLTALLDGPGGSCFSTFLAETRSSQEKTAQLKDFTGGELSTCPPAPVTTTATPGGDVVVPGTTQRDVATLGTVDDLGTPTGTVTFFLCGPDEVTTDGCSSGGTQVGTPATVNNGTATSADVDGSSTPNDNEPGKYCWRAEYTPDKASAGVYLPSSETNDKVAVDNAECFVVVATPPSSGSTTPTPPPSHETSGTSEVPPSLSVSATSVGPVANTGAGPVRGEVIWAAGLLVLGSALAYVGRRRGYLRRH